jgi:hypothetical protein
MPSEMNSTSVSVKLTGLEMTVRSTGDLVMTNAMDVMVQMLMTVDTVSLMHIGTTIRNVNVTQNGKVMIVAHGMEHVM